MKTIQELIYVVVLGKIFITWYKHEQENADEITKEDLQSRENMYDAWVSK